MDVTAVTATLSFDCRLRVARADATVSFTLGGDASPAVFDLRQEIETAELDGSPLDAGLLAPTADGVRAIDVALAEGDHELRLAYSLELPTVTDPLPVGWTSNAPGVVFDFWMSDLHPGRYLEQWIPAPLCHDRFALAVELDISGTPEPHAVFANGAFSSSGVTYASTGTSLSPMLVVAPEARVEVEDAGGITVCKLAGPEIDLGSCHSRIRGFLDTNAAAFGDYAFGDRFVAYLWASSRGMEYDGATTSSVDALEHEVFHSWFGRGVKPATANDGWFDEAFTVWFTSSSPGRRQWAAPFDWSVPPCVLRPVGEFARFTPREAYSIGPTLFAGVAHALGGPDALVGAMAALYRDRVGGFVTTDEVMEALGGSDVVRIAFDRWVHGQDVRP